MQTLVYFSNDGIQVLQGIIKGGQLNITSFKTLPVEAGALINGVITNEELVKEAITEAVKENPALFKSIRLVIDSSLIATKNVEVPKLKPNELAALAINEFEDSAGNYDELVVDYAQILGVNGSNIFCCGVEKRVLESYVNLFESLKTKVTGIDVGMNAIIQYVTATRDFKGMTFAFNILDGKNLVSFLFENGIYIFSTRSRLLSERGTDAFADELSGKLSSLIQFNKSQKSAHALNMSLYAGLDEYELNALKALNFDPELSLFIMPKTPNVKIGFSMEESFDFGKFLIPMAGFFAGMKPINLYAAYKKTAVVERKLPFEYQALIIPGALIGVCLLVFITFFGLRFIALKNLESLNAYISDPANQSEYMQAMELSKEVSGLETAIANLEAINAAIKSNPQLDTNLMNTLSSLCNGVIVLNAMEYDGVKGVIRITATANNEKEAAHYIERLKGTQLFAGVGYSGYARIGTSTQTTGTGTNSTVTAGSSGFGFVADVYLKAGGMQ